MIGIFVLTMDKFLKVIMEEAVENLSLEILPHFSYCPDVTQDDLTHREIFKRLKIQDGQFFRDNLQKLVFLKRGNCIEK